MSEQQKINWRFTQESPSQEILESWQKLCHESSLISASSTPAFACNANKLVGTKVFFATGYINDQLVTALPLVIKNTTRFGVSLKYLQVAVHDHLDYFVAAGQSELSESELINGLIAACKKHIKGWHWFFSRRWFIKSSISPSMLSQSYQRQAAYFDLATKQAISDVISKKLLKNLNRFEKKIKAAGDDLEMLQFSEKSLVANSLEIFYRLEAAGWKGDAGSAISQTPSLKEFYDQCWQQFSESENARLFELRQKDHTIAACIAYQHNSTLFLHKITYDESLSKMSPGSILVKKIIERCILQSEIKKLCFNTNPPWVQRWHPQLDKLQAVQGFNSNFKGFTCRLSVKLYCLLRRIKRRIQKRG